MRSGVISRMALGDGARSTAGLPWQPVQRVWNVAKPLSVPGVNPRPPPGGGGACVAGAWAPAWPAAGACACVTATKRQRPRPNHKAAERVFLFTGVKISLSESRWPDPEASTPRCARGDRLKFTIRPTVSHVDGIRDARHRLETDEIPLRGWGRSLPAAACP